MKIFQAVCLTASMLIEADFNYKTIFTDKSYLCIYSFVGPMLGLTDVEWLTFSAVCFLHLYIQKRENTVLLEDVGNYFANNNSYNFKNAAEVYESIISLAETKYLHISKNWDIYGIPRFEIDVPLECIKKYLPMEY